MPDHPHYAITMEQRNDYRTGKLALLLHKSVEEIEDMSLRSVALIWEVHQLEEELDAISRKRGAS